MCLGTKEYKDETATAEVTQKWQAIKEDGTKVTASTEDELKQKLGRKYVFQKSLGEVYVDGSCSWPRHRTAARAAWAATQVDNDGEVIVAGQGTVSNCFRQRAVEGEQTCNPHG